MNIVDNSALSYGGDFVLGVSFRRGILFGGDFVRTPRRSYIDTFSRRLLTSQTDVWSLTVHAAQPMWNKPPNFLTQRLL